MHSKPILGAMLATMSLGTALPSFAQPRDHDRPANERRDERGPQRPDRDRVPEREAQRGHGQWEREMREPARFGARGPEWHRGGHIPPAYRDHVYVVNDWRAHRLAAPPRGYEWIQVGPDYVLVAVRTGVIAQIMVMG